MNIEAKQKYYDTVINEFVKKEEMEQAKPSKDTADPTNKRLNEAVSGYGHREDKQIDLRDAKYPYESHKWKKVMEVQDELDQLAQVWGKESEGFGICYFVVF